VTSLLPLLLLPMCWFLLIRPQRQRVARHQQLLAAIQPGDEVVTAGGVLATVVAINPGRISLEIAPGVVIQVLPPAVTGRPAAVKDTAR
jgi:preprotein translocase subunit YajC